MKLTDLLEKQQIIVQINWGGQKIEFASEVIIYAICNCKTI